MFGVLTIENIEQYFGRNFDIIQNILSKESVE